MYISYSQVPIPSPSREREAAPTREFKLEAVRLIKERGVSYVRTSQHWGVHVSQLRDWVKKFADETKRELMYSTTSSASTIRNAGCVYRKLDSA